MSRALAWISLVIIFPVKSYAQGGICLDPSSEAIGKHRFVSLVFASQNYKSPVSMFGHTFLMFHSKEFPEPDSITLEFMGITEGQSGSTIKAIVGNLPGQFRLNCFYQKRQEYDLEGRDLWIYRLNLNSDERTKLEKRMDKIELEKLNYGFIRSNCADRIHRLILDVLSRKPKLSIAHVPIAGVRDLKSIGKITSSPLFIPSSLRVLSHAYDKLNFQEKASFNSVLNGAALQESEKYVNKALSRFVNYRIRKEPSPKKRHQLFLLKKSSNSVYVAVPTPIDPSEQSSFKSIKLSYLLPINAFQFEYLPGVQSFWNSYPNIFQSSYLEFFRIALSIKKSSFRLQGFTIFDIDILKGASRFDSFFARYIYLGYSDLTDWFDSEHRQYELRFGGGWAHTFFKMIDLSLIPFFGGGYYKTPLNSNLGFEFGLKLKTYWKLPFGIRTELTVEHLFLEQRGYRDYLKLDTLFNFGKKWNFGLSYLNVRYNTSIYGLVSSIRF